MSFGNPGLPSSKPTVWVVDQRGLFHCFVHESLAPLGYEVVWKSDAATTVSRLPKEGVRAVLVDVCVPGDTILEGVDSVIQAETEARTIVVTGCPVMDAAARVLYPGADSFLRWPCTADELQATVEATGRIDLDGDRTAVIHGIVGTSPGIRRVIEQIHRVGPTSATVLITGETGTGKELVAEAIHMCSPRRDGPYVVIDTAALPESLQESELFGHTRGAFTGATSSKPGLFEAADGGTIFLDEIGDVPQTIQLRLLRAIQERQVRRVGALKATGVDVRIVAATQREPEEAMESGRLRRDLYYRLSSYTIDIPPLRERREDIRPLVEYVLTSTEIAESRTSSCSDLVIRMLESYRWPGNVRELLSVLEQAAIDAGGARISATDLPERVQVAWRKDVLGDPQRDERAAVLQALQEVDGGRAEAAELLGVSRTTLWRWMKRHDLL